MRGMVDGWLAGGQARWLDVYSLLLHLGHSALGCCCSDKVLFRAINPPCSPSPQAVDIEREFVCDALPVDLIGMNGRLMAQVGWVGG